MSSDAQDFSEDEFDGQVDDPNADQKENVDFPLSDFLTTEELQRLEDPPSEPSLPAEANLPAESKVKTKK